MKRLHKFFQGPTTASLFCFFGGDLDKEWMLHFGMKGPNKWAFGRQDAWYDGPIVWYCLGPFIQFGKRP